MTACNASEWSIEGNHGRTFAACSDCVTQHELTAYLLGLVTEPLPCDYCQLWLT